MLTVGWEGKHNNILEVGIAYITVPVLNGIMLQMEWKNPKVKENPKVAFKFLELSLSESETFHNN